MKTWSLAIAWNWEFDEDFVAVGVVVGACERGTQHGQLRALGDTLRDEVDELTGAALMNPHVEQLGAVNGERVRVFILGAHRERFVGQDLGPAGVAVE